MSSQNGTPSKTEWALGQCAQVQSAFVKATPQALGDVRYNPKVVLDVFKENGDVLEQEMSLFINSFVKKYSWSFRICRSDITIRIPALPRPTLQEIRAEYPKVLSIKRDVSPTKAVIMKFATVLRLDEEQLGHEDYKNRVALISKPLLGYQHAAWILRNIQEFPELRGLLSMDFVINFAGFVAEHENRGLLSPFLSKSFVNSREINWDCVDTLYKNVFISISA